MAAAAGPGLLLGGRTVDRAGGPFARASQVLIDHLYDHYGTDREGAFFASNNLAADREAFLAMGGFDTNFPEPGGEDRELGDRWAARGGAHRFVPDAIVDHHHAMGWREFWRQHRTYGEGAFHYHRTRAPRVGHGPRPEPPSFYVRLVTRPLRVSTEQPVRTAGLLVVAQVANAAGFARAARRSHAARR
jgi:GT2 family glycosyltransferase